MVNEDGRPGIESGRGLPPAGNGGGTVNESPSGWLAKYLARIESDLAEMRKEQRQHGEILAVLKAAREEAREAAIQEARAIAETQSTASRRQQLAMGGTAGGAVILLLEIVKLLTSAISGPSGR